MKQYFNFLFIIIFCLSCATKKVPVWVKDFGSRNFSKDGIEGIGFAKFDKKDKSTFRTARESAYNEAMKNLALKLKTHIKGTIEHRMKDKISLVDNKYSQQATDQVEVLTNLMFETVLGRKYFEEYIDRKNSLYWVYVWTTKAELQKSLEEEIEKQEIHNMNIMKLCLENLKTLEEKIYSGNLIFAISQLEKILFQLEEVKGVYIFDKVDNISLKFEVETKLNKILSSINFFSLSLDKIEVIKNQQLNLDLNLKMELLYDNKKIPVVGFPLICSFLKGSGDCDNITYTNEEGIAKFKIYKLTSKENIIEIRPDMETLKKYINKIEIFANLKVIYNIIAKSEKETKKFAIKIENIDKYKNEIIKNEIISLLKNQEFNIVDDINTTDYILYVIVNIEEMGSKISFNDSQSSLEIFSGSATIELKNVLYNSIILSKSFVSIKGFGKTKKEAEQNTLKKLAEVISEYIIKNFD